MKKVINNYTRKYILSILACAFLITSCEYDPVEKYIADLIRPTEVPPIEVDLNLLTDTVTIYWGSEVSLRIDAGTLKVNSVRYFLDGTEVFGSYSNSKYYIGLTFSEPGIHKFKMIISTNTGTGSIADRLRLEEFKYESREWTLLAEGYNAYSNLTYRVDNNGLLFAWKAYDGLDFKFYRLKEQATGNSFDIFSTSFNYNYYVGEGSDFYLYVVDKNNNEYLWGRCSVDKRLPLIRIGNINNKVALIWNKTIFSENIAEYQLFQQVQGSGWTNIGTFTNKDTSFLLKVNDNIFGERVSFYLYCVPNNYSSIDNNSLFSSFLFDANAALPGPIYGNHYYGASCDGFYFDLYSSVYQKYGLYRYSTATEHIDSLMDYNFWWNFSPNARYLLLSSDSILHLYDLNTNFISKSKNFKSITKDFYPWAGTIISDNGICIFTLNNVLYVYDFMNDKLIASENMVINALKISPDGQYFTGTRSDSLLVYRINENSVSIITGAKQSNGTSWFTNYDFCADHSDYLYIYESPVLSILSCLDFSVIRSFDIGEYFNNIDFCSGKVLSARIGGIWDIYDFNSGELLQTMRSEISNGCSECVVLTNNTIFIPGYKFFLQDLN